MRLIVLTCWTDSQITPAATSPIPLLLKRGNGHSLWVRRSNGQNCLALWPWPYQFPFPNCSPVQHCSLSISISVTLLSFCDLSFSWLHLSLVTEPLALFPPVWPSPDFFYSVSLTVFSQGTGSHLGTLLYSEFLLGKGAIASERKSLGALMK